MQYRLIGSLGWVVFKIFLKDEDQPGSAQRFPLSLLTSVAQVPRRQSARYDGPYPAKQHGRRGEFSPYTNNEGTVAAVAGSDFVIVGGDTRLAEGGNYSILTRNESKLVQLTDKTILATSGMFADFCELTRVSFSTTLGPQGKARNLRLQD
jgi:hypothetical protein